MFRMNLRLTRQYGYSDFSHMRGLDGVLHQLAGILQRKFFLQMTLVGFDGLDAEMKFFGDLARTVAFADQVKHFQLPIR